MEIISLAKKDRNFFVEEIGLEYDLKNRKAPQKTKQEIINSKLIMINLGKGNVAKGKKRFNQLIKRKVYWLSEINEMETYVLQSQGYTLSNPRCKDKKKVVKNEKGFFEYIIAEVPMNENMQHLRDKEFISFLNKEAATIEYLIPKTMNRIDVVFNFDKKTIGVEVQNSSLEFSRLKEKIDLLKQNFDYWFFIINKKEVEKYEFFNDEKGEVLCMVDAIKKIKKLVRKS